MLSSKMWAMMRLSAEIVSVTEAGSEVVFNSAALHCLRLSHSDLTSYPMEDGDVSAIRKREKEKNSLQKCPINHLLPSSLNCRDSSWFAKQRRRFTNFARSWQILCVWDERRWREEQRETESGSASTNWPEVTGKLWPEGGHIVVHSLQLGC